MTKANIKKVLKDRGWSASRLAEHMKGKNGEVGVSQASVSQIINGNPTIGKLEEIASIIGCKVGDFFTDSSDFVAFVRKNGTTFTFDSEDDLRRWVDDSK